MSVSKEDIAALRDICEITDELDDEERALLRRVAEHLEGERAVLDACKPNTIPLIVSAVNACCDDQEKDQVGRLLLVIARLAGPLPSPPSV